MTKDKIEDWHKDFDKAWRESHMYLFKFSGAIDQNPIKKLISFLLDKQKKEIAEKIFKELCTMEHSVDYRNGLDRAIDIINNK